MMNAVLVVELIGRALRIPKCPENQRGVLDCARLGNPGLARVWLWGTIICSVIPHLLYDPVTQLVVTGLI